MSADLAQTRELSDEQLLAKGTVRIRDAAELTGMSVSFFNKGTERGTIPFVRKVGRARLIPRVWIEHFLADGLVRCDRRAS